MTPLGHPLETSVKRAPHAANVDVAVLHLLAKGRRGDRVDRPDELGVVEVEREVLNLGLCRALAVSVGQSREKVAAGERAASGQSAVR